MNKRLAFFLLMFFSSIAFANNLKIGIINMREVLLKAPQSEEINKSLEKEFLPRKNTIITAQKTLKEKNDKYQKDSEVMSENERKKAEKELIEKQRDLQRMESEYREDGQARQREETDKLLKQVSGVLAQIAKKENYDLILHSEAAPYVSAQIDVTSKVIDSLKVAK